MRNLRCKQLIEMLMQYFEKPTEEEESLFYVATVQILLFAGHAMPIQLSENRWGSIAESRIQTGTKAYQQLQLFGIWVQNKTYFTTLHR